jgi:hypothetical protein
MPCSQGLLKSGVSQRKQAWHPLAVQRRYDRDMEVTDVRAARGICDPSATLFLRRSGEPERHRTISKMAKPNAHEPQSGYSLSSTVQYRLLEL